MQRRQRRSTRYWRYMADWRQNPPGTHKVVPHLPAAITLGQSDEPSDMTYFRVPDEAPRPVVAELLPPKPLDPPQETLTMEEPHAGLSGVVGFLPRPGDPAFFKARGAIDDSGPIVPDGLYHYIFEVTFWMPKLEVTKAFEGYFTIDLSKYVTDYTVKTWFQPVLGDYPTVMAIVEFIGHQITSLPTIGISWEASWISTNQVSGYGHIIMSLQRSRYDFMQYLSSVHVVYDDEDSLAVESHAAQRPRTRRLSCLRPLISRLLRSRRR